MRERGGALIETGHWHTFPTKKHNIEMTIDCVEWIL